MTTSPTSFGPHLIGIEPLERTQIEAVLARAAEMKRAWASQGPAGVPRLGGVLVNAFFENSTRTRTSFEVAATRLGAAVVNFDVGSSSVKKGESLLDTARTIDAMEPRWLVVRHASAGVPAMLAEVVRASVINAGDGAHAHPTQALLDALTLTEKFGGVRGLRIAIVGDILHSRVARSNLWCLGKLGASVVLVGPRALCPDGLAGFGGFDVRVAHTLEEGLPGVDAVMLLRIQHERMKKGLFPSVGEYQRMYGLTSERLTALAPRAMVMHPGPFNRGVEISGDLADGERSLILHQVANGVPTRMAVLAMLAEGRGEGRR